MESVTIVGIIGLLALALGLAAFLRPTSVQKTSKLTYTQSGAFTYSAVGQTGSLYGAKGLTTGQPILANKVGPVRAAFTYRLASDAPADVHGTTTMAAKVDLGQGLTKTFTVAKAHSFAGTRARVSGVLPLDSIMSYVKKANHALGDLGGATETVTLTPRVKYSGTVGGHALKQTTYAPSLPFTLSGTTLTISKSDSGSTDPSTPASDPLKPSKSGAVSYRASKPNTVPLLVAHPSVTSARLVGFAVAALCLLLCIWFARPLRTGRSPGDRDRIRALYGARLVPVERLASHFGPVADVSSIDALAELAKRYESMIMVVREGDADSYVVWDNGILYRYLAAADAHQPTEETAPVAEGGDLDGPVQRLAFDLEGGGPALPPTSETTGL
jgi:hypothetical protein